MLPRNLASLLPAVRLSGSLPAPIQPPSSHAQQAQVPSSKAFSISPAHPRRRFVTLRSGVGMCLPIRAGDRPMLGPLGVGEQVLLISAQQQPPPVGTSPLARRGLERAALGAGGTRRRRKRKVQSSNKTWGGVRRAVQSLTIFLFWEGWEPEKFPVGKKSIPAFSREECWKSPLCRARLISVHEPDPDSAAHPQPSFLGAPRLTVRTKPGSHLPPSRSLMGGLFLSPFECSGHYERPHCFHVLIEPLMNGIGTAHRQSHRIPPWSPNPSSQRDTRCRVYFTQ